MLSLAKLFVTSILMQAAALPSPRPSAPQPDDDIVEMRAEEAIPADAAYPTEPPSPKSEAYGDVWRWHIVKSPLGCSALLPVQREGETLNYVMFYYRPAQALVEISFSSQHSASLAPGAVRALEVIFLDAQRKMDGRFNRVSFKVSDDGAGGRSFRTENGLPASVFANIAKDSEIAFFYQGKIVAFYPLFYSSKMIPVLKKCAFEVTGLDPRDPFIQ